VANVEFTGSVGGNSLPKAEFMLVGAPSPTAQKWRFNVNRTPFGLLLQHNGGSFADIATAPVWAWSALLDALRRNDWGTSDCTYPGGWKIAQLAGGTRIKLNAATLFTGLNSTDIYTLIEFLEFQVP
jgi:hypothetical protein